MQHIWILIHVLYVEEDIQYTVATVLLKEKRTTETNLNLGPIDFLD